MAFPRCMASFTILVLFICKYCTIRSVRIYRLLWESLVLLCRCNNRKQNRRRVIRFTFNIHQRARSGVTVNHYLQELLYHNGPWYDLYFACHTLLKRCYGIRPTTDRYLVTNQKRLSIDWLQSALSLHKPNYPSIIIHIHFCRKFTTFFPGISETYRLTPRTLVW